MKDGLKLGAPPGTVFTCNESGWMTTETFCLWMEHFVNYVKPSVDQPVLLILDGHTTHTRNIEAITLAQASGVIMLSLPAHTTHKLQPLDVSIFRPLMVYYDQALSTWLRSNPGQVVTGFQVSSLLGENCA